MKVTIARTHGLNAEYPKTLNSLIMTTITLNPQTQPSTVNPKPGSEFIESLFGFKKIQRVYAGLGFVGDCNG